MNQDTTLLTHVRSLLNRQFADFVDQVGLTQDDFRPASVDSRQLDVAARRCLLTLDQFRAWVPRGPTLEIEEQLRKCASIAVELSEVLFMLQLLNAAQAIEITGGDLVRKRCRLRIQRYEYKLVRLRQKLASQRLAVQMERLMAGLAYGGENPEPNLADFSREMHS